MVSEVVNVSCHAVHHNMGALKYKKKEQLKEYLIYLLVKLPKKPATCKRTLYFGTCTYF